MRIGKKFLSILLAILLLWIPANAVVASAALNEAGVDPETEDYGPDIRGETYCVIDGDTGEVLLSKGKDEKKYPASTTKVMTALLVCENVEDLDAKLTFTKSSVSVDPSSSTLHPKAMNGETMTVRDALYGMLLQSANECAAMLGEYVGGSEKEFAKMMNKRAKEIGCKNTHFVNAHGFHDEDHYTTAYDLCLILREAMKNETYREVNQTVTYTIKATNMSEARTFEVGHQMLQGSIPEEGVIGGKTGSTPQAGRVLVTACDRDGLYTISSLMASDTDNFYHDEQVLLEFAYGLFNQILPPYDPVIVNDTVTAHDGVRLRYSPSVKGGQYIVTTEGMEFKRTAMYGDWSQVLYNDHVYYAATEYLESDAPEKVPVTEAYVYESKAPEKTTEGNEGTKEVSDSETGANGESSEPASNSSSVTAGENTADPLYTTDGSETYPPRESGEEVQEQKDPSDSKTETIRKTLVIMLIAVLTVVVILIILAIIYFVRSAGKKRRNKKRYQE